MPPGCETKECWARALTNRYVPMRNVTLTAVLVLLTCSLSFASETKRAKVVGPDATTGMAQALVLDDVTLIQTTQLLPAESRERLELMEAPASKRSIWSAISARCWQTRAQGCSTS